MNENEQVQEMAREMCGLNTDKGCFCDGGYCNYNCLAYEKAKALYSKDYRKVERGEWEKSPIPGEDYNCSVCGGASWNYDDFGDICKSNFCPNCGADMRGATDER